MQEAGPIKALFQVYESEPVLSFPLRMQAASLRFVACPIFINSDAFSTSNPSSHAFSNSSLVKVWGALVVQHAQVLYGRAEDLAHLMSQLKADCLEESPNPAVLMLQPHEVWASDVHCQAHWGPEDIEAECWLEAAAAFQLPVAELAMDFEVHSSSEGNWLAHCWACPQSLVKAYLVQLSALGLELEIITCATQSNELSAAWGLQPAVMAEAFRLPCKGELASQYFNLFKEDKPC